MLTEPLYDPINDDVDVVDRIRLGYGIGDDATFEVTRAGEDKKL